MTSDRCKKKTVFWASLLCAAAVAWPAPATTGDEDAIRKLVRQSRQTYRRAQIAYWNGFPKAAFRLYRQSLADLKRARTLAPGRFIDRFRRIDAAFYQDMVKLSQAMFGVGASHYQQGKAASACGLFWRSLRLVRFAEELTQNRYRTRFRRVYFRIAQDFGRVIRPRDLGRIMTACTGRMVKRFAPSRTVARRVTKPRRQAQKHRRVKPLRFDPREPWVGPVKRRIRWLTAYRRGFLKRSLRRAERHLPMIRRVFRSFGIPQSLAYMALIESGFRTSPTSRAGARGLWQFIPSTARTYGLRVNWRMDDRLDPVKSTYAAAMFLTDLYKKFKDWPLAVAAYNCGESRIDRLLKAHKARTFWDLHRLGVLPTETANYVPAIIAATIISHNRRHYGLSR